MNYQPTPEGKDPQLWQTASRRASFKRHLATYLIINVFLWVLWYLTDGDVNDNGIPWPAWTTFGWGIGLLFHYLGAYVNTGYGSVEREYDKLKNQNK
ncbi:MAG TPA: 2TM domain-containing protein [Chitinophagaceae bacterium]|nr:2TM domain-containing protein [Chitinophagaceae bacterium]